LYDFVIKDIKSSLKLNSNIDPSDWRMPQLYLFLNGIKPLKSRKIDKGEFISIIGPSGSGKTTLLLVLAGMAEPSAGYIRVGDIRLDQLTEEDRSNYRRFKVGTLWQIPNRNLIWEINIFENVEIPMRLLGIQREERIRRVKELLGEVGLSKRMNHKPQQLSGGEVQRAGLACALAHQPYLLSQSQKELP